MELDFDKYCKLSESPNTVLPSPSRRSKADKRRSSKKDLNLFTLEEDFTEINFHRFRSISCKNVAARASGIERNEVLRRGSVYQSSHERTRMKSNEDFEGRKKIEFSGEDSKVSSFSIVDSLCSSDEDSSIPEIKRSSVMSRTSELSSKKCFDSGKENGISLERAKNESCHFRETSTGLNKSLSTKLAIPQSPSQTESDSSRPSSPKTRFGPIRKMFDPFTKSKSHRSPLGPSSDIIRKNDTLPKSMLGDFASRPEVPETISSSCSPAHLHGCLKVETKGGTPIFEFSLKFPEDILVARRWKDEKGLNWVYTFHSFPNRRKSNAASQWEMKDLKRASSMVGQMQVSCYLNMDVKVKGTFDNSMMTEFVLYDVTKPEKFERLAKKSLEIAAAVLQIPYEKRESLKHKSDHRHPSLLDLCEIKERRGGDSDLRVNIVIPSGTHGLPTADEASCGPSSLLDRWRSGGACDCGGWDMACPLTVFGNPDIQFIDDRLVLEKHQPLELFDKGGKENTPALSITAFNEGCYTVDFHAKLSTLQAFSMCIAMLHCTEASTTATQEREKQISKSDSLRVFVEEEISDLIEAVAEEEKRIESKKTGETLPSFKIKPPFSPMSRV